ncbi:hypothetical protein NDN08_000722 [Rhodosorus marinus]|uniref:HEAT repeat-containing protein 1 n=1 Tax=Rhodosorus marinus TaxID=101924 RepID=A0AAV8UNS9_9RHOD|nr:hypothetical protein NDN08_000722 [Rhodosorus marinus]
MKAAVDQSVDDEGLGYCRDDEWRRQHQISRRRAYEIVLHLNSNREIGAEEQDSPESGEIDFENGSWLLVAGTLVEHGYTVAELQHRYSSQHRTLLILHRNRDASLFSYIESLLAELLILCYNHPRQHIYPSSSSNDSGRDLSGFALLVRVREVCEDLGERFWTVLGRVIKKLKTSKRSWSKPTSEENWFSKFVWTVIMSWGPIGSYSLTTRDPLSRVVEVSGTVRLPEDHDGWVLVGQLLRDNWRFLNIDWDKTIIPNIEKLGVWWGWSPSVAQASLEVLRCHHVHSRKRRVPESILLVNSHKCNSRLCAGVVLLAGRIVQNLSPQGRALYKDQCSAFIDGLERNSEYFSSPAGIREHCLDLQLSMGECYDSLPMWIQRLRKMVLGGDDQVDERILTYAQGLSSRALRLNSKGEYMRPICEALADVISLLANRMIETNSQVNGFGHRGGPQDPLIIEELKNRLRRNDKSLCSLMQHMRVFVESLSWSSSQYTNTARSVFPLLEVKLNGMIRLSEVLNLVAPIAVMEFCASLTAVATTQSCENGDTSTLRNRLDEDFLFDVDPDALIWRNKLATSLRSNSLDNLSLMIKKLESRYSTRSHGHQESQNPNHRTNLKCAKALGSLLTYFYNCRFIQDATEMFSRSPLISGYQSLSKILRFEHGQDLCCSHMTPFLRGLDGRGCQDPFFLRALGLTLSAVLFRSLVEVEEPSLAAVDFVSAVQANASVRSHLLSDELASKLNRFPEKQSMNQLLEHTLFKFRSDFMQSHVATMDMEYLRCSTALVVSMVRGRLPENVLASGSSAFSGISDDRRIATSTTKAAKIFCDLLARYKFLSPLEPARAEALDLCFELLGLIAGTFELGDTLCECISLLIPVMCQDNARRELLLALITRLLRTTNSDDVVGAIASGIFSSESDQVSSTFRAETLNDIVLRLCKRRSNGYSNCRELLLRFWTSENMSIHQNEMVATAKVMMSLDILQILLDYHDSSARTCEPVDHTAIFRTAGRLVNLFGCSAFLHEHMVDYILSVVYCGLCEVDYVLFKSSGSRSNSRKAWRKLLVSHGRKFVYSSEFSSLLPGEQRFLPKHGLLRSPEIFVNLLHSIFESGSFGRDIMKYDVLPELCKTVQDLELMAQMGEMTTSDVRTEIITIDGPSQELGRKLTEFFRETCNGLSASKITTL